MRKAWNCVSVCLVFVSSIVAAGEWTEAEKMQIAELRKRLEKSISVEIVGLPVFRALELIAQVPRMEPEEKEAGKLPAELAKRLEKKVSLTFLETPFEKAVAVFAEQ